MKLHIRYLVLLPLLMMACADESKTREGEPVTPKALEENNSSYNIVSKRGTGNMVDQLYAEIIEKDTALGHLEKWMDVLPRMKEDSLRDFHSFGQKNNSYYESAKALVQGMPDSLMRTLVDSILDKSIKKYNNLVSRHEKAEKDIEEQTRQLQSAYVLCKLAYTLPVMEEFQKQLPPVSSLEGYKNQLDSVIGKTNALTSKKLK